MSSEDSPQEDGNASFPEGPPPWEDTIVVLNVSQVQMIMMTLLATIGLICCIWAVQTIKKNAHFQGIVEHYVLIDVIALTTINTNHLWWGVPCNLWFLNETLPILDFFFGGLTFCALAITFPSKICLTVNRFLAISFDGQYYRKFESLKPLQYAIIILYPTAVAVPFFIPGCHPIFIPYGLSFYFMEDGPCGETHIYITQVLVCYCTLGTVVFFDIATFYLIRVKLRKYSENSSSKAKEDLKKDLKMAAQMLANLFLGAFVTLSFTFGVWLVKTDFEQFLLFTSFWQLFCVLKCITYIYFLRPIKDTRSRETTISVSPSVNRR